MIFSHLVFCALTPSPIEFIYSTLTYRLSSPSLLLLLGFCSCYLQSNPFQNFPPEIYFPNQKTTLPLAPHYVKNKSQTHQDERLSPISFSRHKPHHRYHLTFIMAQMTYLQNPEFSKQFPLCFKACFNLLAYNTFFFWGNNILIISCLTRGSVNRLIKAFLYQKVLLPSAL